ncbi:hypothetical protein ACYBSK_19100 [Streptomyces sp. BYX5S]
MTDRIPLDQLTRDQLDALFDDLDRYEEAVGEQNETVIGLARRVARAEAAVARVRALHVDEDGVCAHCSNLGEASVLAPCSTIQALDVQEQPAL